MSEHASSESMWPWEHVLFAYVFYSPYVHLAYRSAPTGWPAAALAVGALFPDLVDKPLAWQFGLVETGWGPAHSVFLAVPVALFVYAVARHRGVGAVGVAFGFGYLLHLPGDVVPASLSRGRLYLAPVLWPRSDPAVDADHGSFLDGVYSLLTEYAVQLLALEVTTGVALQVGTVAVGGLLWLYDGLPGLRLLAVPIRYIAGYLRLS
jgi:hypothetical protein